MCTHPAVTETTTELLEFLRQPASYANRPQSVELRETHISWVFLTGSYAYKLKKPVRFDFLDFSTCDLRKQACQAELRLNRRLSPSVYRAVVPIRRHKSGKLFLGGNETTGYAIDGNHAGRNQTDGSGAEVVDWLVKMRQLDDNRTLQAHLQKTAHDNDLDAKIQTVAAHLAQFYAAQAPVTVRTTEFRDSLRRHVRENERRLLQTDPSATDRNLIRLVHSSQKRFLVTHQNVFDNRVRDGRIVDGHGDLRPDHIYLYNRPLVIDCVEFNAEYRTNDIVDELAFLAMECNRLGDHSVGRALYHAYLQTGQDIPSEQLVAFYKIYRACVRAKVAALRSGQQANAPAVASIRAEHQYLQLAKSYLRDLGPRLVLLVGGLMGTGKSTLAEQLSQLLSAEVIRSDTVRQPRGEASREESTATFDEGQYSPQARRQTYEAMFAAAGESFARNDTIILDATFSSLQFRRRAAELASAHGARLLQVQCRCPRETAIGRIADRLRRGDSASEARPEFYDRQAAESDPPLPSAPLVEVDTTLALGRQEAIVLEQVQNVLS